MPAATKAPRTSTPSARTASDAFSTGTTRRRMPAAARHRAIGNTPVTGRSDASSASSPRKASPSRRIDWSSARMIAIAIARSKPVPSFGKLRGSEIDGDPSLRELVARVTDGRLDPLPCLLDRSVREAHDGERRQAVGDVRLDRDRHAGEASGRATYCTRNHTRKCSRDAVSAAVVAPR